jgi:CAAX protease family protein
MTSDNTGENPQSITQATRDGLVTSRISGAAEILAVLGVPVVLIGGSFLLSGDPGLVQLATLVSILLMVVLAYVGLRRRGQGLDHFGMTFRFGSLGDLARILPRAAAALVVAAGLFVGAAYGFNAVFAPAQAETTGLEFLSGNLPMLLIMLAVIYVTASFSEEFIYRGFLMHRIAELGGSSRASWGVALVVSSILFGLAHFSWGTAGMVQTGFMGLGLGASYIWFGRRLWVVILAHGAMDTFLLTEAYLSGGG